MPTPLFMTITSVETHWSNLPQLSCGERNNLYDDFKRQENQPRVRGMIFPLELPTFSGVWLSKRKWLQKQTALCPSAQHFRNDVHFSIICILVGWELLHYFKQTTCWLPSFPRFEVLQTWIHLITHQVAAIILMECIRVRWEFCSNVLKLGCGPFPLPSTRFSFRDIFLSYVPWVFQTISSS